MDIIDSGFDRNRPYTDVEVSVKALQTIMAYQNVSGQLLTRKGTNVLVRLFTARGVDHDVAIGDLLQIIEENHG